MTDGPTHGTPTTMLATSLLQLAAPAPGQEPWPYIAFAALTAVGVLFWQLQKSKDDQITTCATDKSTCVVTLAATVEAQRALTTEVKTGSDGERDWRTTQDRRFERSEGRLEALERGVAELLEHARRGR